MDGGRARAGLLALVALLAAPPAAAQANVSEQAPVEAVPPAGVVLAMLRIATVDGDFAPLQEGWLLAGHDSVVDLVVHNGGGRWWNATFRVEASGADASADQVSVSVPPSGRASATFAVHPEDAGLVVLSAEAVDAFQPGGGAVVATLEAPALLVPSVAFVDPAPRRVAADDGFDRVDMFSGSRTPWQAHVRVAPGEPVRPRIEVRNGLLAPTPAFDLRLVGARDVGPVEVPALDPGESVTLDGPTFVPVEDAGGRGGYRGPMGRFDERAVGAFTVGGVERTVHLAEYAVEAGAVAGLLPTALVVDVQEGLAVELRVPREPRLGVPTRIAVDVANDGATALAGTLVVTLQTPAGLFYEVQGPASRRVRVDLAPGGQTSDVLEFTPRVTGTWHVQAVFLSAEGFAYGGGGGNFHIDSPLRLVVDRGGVTYARIGERVAMGLAIASEETLADAELRVTTGLGRSMGAEDAGGAFRAGLVHRLLDVGGPSSSLGTLRPGGSVDASLEIAGRSSGAYAVVAYVLSEGFAYATQPFDRDGNSMGFAGPYGNAASMWLVVSPRPVPAALALLPLTVGLAVFVGAWTMRTRLVR